MRKLHGVVVESSVEYKIDPPRRVHEPDVKAQFMPCDCCRGLETKSENLGGNRQDIRMSARATRSDSCPPPARTHASGHARTAKAGKGPPFGPANCLPDPRGPSRA